MVDRTVIAAVVPTIDADHLRGALPWLSELRRLGVTPVVAANSAATASVPLPEGFVRSSDGTNPGFARSVNRGARAVDGWDWLVLLNDDLHLDPAVVEALVAALHEADRDEPQVLMFDPEPPRVIPSPVRALVGLSLLTEVLGRVERARRPEDPGQGGIPAGTFKSFSAVAISRRAWESVGPLSEAFLFCYEDVEYVRRLESAGGGLRAVPLPIQHNKSASTKSRIRFVLPAIADSAVAYAAASGVPVPVARAIAVLSLVLRLPFVLVTSAPRGEHLRGIGTALRLTLTGGAAHLPPFG